MITFALGGGGDEAGRKGWGQEGNSCRVIETMKNEVLKAQRFEIEGYSKLRRSSVRVVTRSQLRRRMLTQICFSFSFHCRHKWNRLPASSPECLNCVPWVEPFVCRESEKVLTDSRASPHSLSPQRASIRFLSLYITRVCLCGLYSSCPNAGVNCLHLNWTHTKHADQTQ